MRASQPHRWLKRLRVIYRPFSPHHVRGSSCHSEKEQPPPHASTSWCYCCRQAIKTIHVEMVQANRQQYTRTVAKGRRPSCVLPDPARVCSPFTSTIFAFQSRDVFDHPKLNVVSSGAPPGVVSSLFTGTNLSLQRRSLICCTGATFS